MSKDSIEIFSENPESDLWRRLLQFTYEENIIKFLEKKEFSYSEKLVDSIIGSFLQAYEYYKFAREANLQTSPLLLYYGTSNLLYGMTNLLTGEVQNINNHGMKITNIPEKETFIAETGVKFFDLKNGGIHVVSKAFDFNENLTDFGEWKLFEFLNSIAEINQDYIQCYNVLCSNVLMLDVFITPDGTLEKIYYNKENKKEVYNLLEDVEGISDSYLPIREGRDMYGYKEYFILRRKINGIDISESSYSGQPYLRAAHNKRNKKITIPTLFNMYIGLFTLSSLCRYHPERWSPFVLNDVTGEKLLIENFLYFSRRMIPNIVLENIEGKKIQYVSDRYKSKDTVKLLGEDKVKEIVQLEVKRQLAHEKLNKTFHI